LRALDGIRRFDRAVLDGVSSGVLVTDARGRVVLRNAAYRTSADTGSAESAGAMRPSEQDLMRRALGGEDLQGIHFRSGPDDAPRALVADARPLRSVDGELLGAVATFADVTDERMVQGRLREAIAFHDAVLAASPDVIFITDVATHRVVWASGTVEPTLGYTPSQVVELDRASRLNLVHPEDIDAMHKTDDAAAGLDDGEVRTVRVRMSNDRGDLRWMSRRVTPFTRNADGRVVELLGVARDVTDAVEVEQRLTDAANRDPLTGLLNRRALLDRLGVLVARASDAEAPPTPVLFCDLDGFKAVNDSLGHAAGDQLLTTVAQRIVSSLRDGDTPARAGGDEFVLLLEPHLARPAETRADVLGRARTVARRILDAVSRPVEVQGTRLAVTISIGIALVRPGIGPGEVLRDADAAMYRAKSTGKNRLHVFEVAPERSRPDRA
jgi:diguanylate cyclase (GGDEF)-like protein/PAS domain S-box-containing protein